MNRTRAIGLAAALALLGLLLFTISTWRPEGRARAVEPMAQVPVEVRATPREIEDTPTAREVQAPAERPLAARPSAPAKPRADDAVPALEKLEPDLQARVPIELRVVDDLGVPVADAEVGIHGLRREGDAGTWYGYRGEEPLGRTDLEGRVRLEHWEWVTIDGRTRSIDLRIAHPDFVPFRDSSFRIGPGEHEAVLQRGSTVVVSGWIGSPATVVNELEIELDRQARLPTGAWTRRPDGRFTTDRVPPGPHLVRVRHESEQHGLCFSEVASFELAEGGYEVLELELLPSVSLHGELEQTVPRPIEAGHVLVVMTQGGAGRAPVLHRSFEARVEPDGTFVVEGLPPGGGYVLALCRGWSSLKTRADSAEQVGLQLFASERQPRNEAKRLEEALDRMNQRAKAHQRVRIPESRAPFVVLMEPTGSVEVQVERTDGRPVAGATVSISPNFHVATVGSWIVPWRAWQRESDSAGRARFDDVPPGETVWVRAYHQELQMRKEDREERNGVEIRPGETAPARIVLEPK